MWLIEFSIDFNDHLHTFMLMHIFMLKYITYVVRVRSRKITKFVAYVSCTRTDDNTVPVNLYS